MRSALIPDGKNETAVINDCPLYQGVTLVYRPITIEEQHSLLDQVKDLNNQRYIAAIALQISKKIVSLKTLTGEEISHDAKSLFKLRIPLFNRINAIIGGSDPGDFLEEKGNDPDSEIERLLESVAQESAAKESGLTIGEQKQDESAKN